MDEGIVSMTDASPLILGLGGGLDRGAEVDESKLRCFSRPSSIESSCTELYRNWMPSSMRSIWSAVTLSARSSAAFTCTTLRANGVKLEPGYLTASCRLDILLDIFSSDFLPFTGQIQGQSLVNCWSAIKNGM